MLAGGGEEEKGMETPGIVFKQLDLLEGFWSFLEVYAGDERLTQLLVRFVTHSPSTTCPVRRTGSGGCFYKVTQLALLTLESHL